MLTKREKEILDFIEQHPLTSQNELSSYFNVSRSGIATHIHNLTRKGYIKGRGYVLSEPYFVTVVGGINMDVIGVPDGQLVPKNSNPGKINYYLGGAGRNIALNLTKLEVPNYFISVYGDDMYGSLFERDSKLNNMNVAYCVKVPSEKTSIYMSVYKNELYYAIDDMSINEYITPEFLEKHIDRINTSKYCIIDANLSKEAIEYIYENTVTPIIAKTVSQNKNSHLMLKNSKVKLLISNEDEIIQMLRDNEINVDSVEEAINHFLSSGFENIVLYQSDMGIRFYNKDEYLFIENKNIQIKNARGASAAITSMAVWGLLSDYDWKYIVQMCYACASLIVGVEDSVFQNLDIELVLDKCDEIF